MIISCYVFFFAGSSGPGNFDPGAVNTQMGSNGMSLNMFGGNI